MSSARVHLPRGWFSLALLQWGAFSDNLAGACVMALMLESVALVRVKWAMGEREFHRAADLTSVIFAVITVVQFSRYGVHGIYQVLVVTPYCFFPLTLAQRASTDGTIPLSALIYSLRKYPDHDRPLDVGPHYVFVCVLAACGSADDYAWIAVASIVLGGVLFAMRPRRYSVVHWSGALFVAAWLALAAGAGVIVAYRSAEGTFAYWMSQFPWTAGNPNRAVTAIGAIGRLKLSDQIRVRVTPGPQVELPLLLQEASFDRFRYGTWTATEAPFEALDKLAGKDAWDTAPAGSRDKQIELVFQHNYELTLLPLPRGTKRVTSGEISEVQRNRFGTIMAEAPPGALRYRADTATSGAAEPPPTDDDLEIPAAYHPVIRDVLAEAGVNDATGDERAATLIRQFFLDNFKYSLVQRRSYGSRLPLADFLRYTRRGHCEFFATASVLALREAGIPARYAVGYVVENYSELERSYIARARHAHAWALAWIDGRWVTLDATPGVWYDLEEARASAWQTVSDLLGWIYYRYQRLLQADFSDTGDWLIWLVPVLAVVLYFRLRRSPMAVHDQATTAAALPAAVRVALDALFAHLATRGFNPGRGETTATFLRRSLGTTPAADQVEALVSDYQRARFAPSGRAPQSEQLVTRIRGRVQTILARLGTLPGS